MDIETVGRIPETIGLKPQSTVSESETGVVRL